MPNAIRKPGTTQPQGRSTAAGPKPAYARMPQRDDHPLRVPTPMPRAAAHGVPRAFIAQLHCPHCGSALEVEAAFPAHEPVVEYGLLRCACHEYPILAGIVVLQQRSPYFAGNLPQAVAHLKRGEYEKALIAALWMPPERERPWLHTVAKLGMPGAGRLIQRARERRFRSVLHDPSLSFRQAVRQFRASFYAHYLFHRHANASFLAATLLNVSLRDAIGGGRTAPRVLDLGCGVGHNSFQLAALRPDADIVACDCDFTNLYLARRFFIPDQICIGLDFEVAMPFADGYFDAVLCSDAFMYIESKEALVRELDRVLCEQGLWVFSHMHNRLVENPAPGWPLSPAEYQRLFGAVAGRLIPEPGMLRRYAAERVLDFTEPADEDSLSSANAFEWVGGRDPGRWCRRFEEVTFPLPPAAPLGINPIYEVQDQGDHLACRARWPDPVFEAECGFATQCIPARCTLDKALLSRVNQGATLPEDAAPLQELLRNFVLVHLPPGYGTA